MVPVSSSGPGAHPFNSNTAHGPNISQVNMAVDSNNILLIIVAAVCVLFVLIAVLLLAIYTKRFVLLTPHIFFLFPSVSPHLFRCVRNLFTKFVPTPTRFIRIFHSRYYVPCFNVFSILFLNCKLLYPLLAIFIFTPSFFVIPYFYFPRSNPDFTAS